MNPISIFATCMTDIATCMSAEDLKTASVMQNKVIYCGECEKFLYEDINGYGFCGETNEECYCGDKCHLINGKP